MKNYQVLKLLKDVANATPSINFYFDRDIYQAVNQNEVKYPVLCMALQSVTVRENYKTLTFQLFAAERLTNGEENRPYAVAELFDIAEEYLHNVGKEDGIVEIEYDRQFNLAEYQTIDIVACIYGTVEIDVENDYQVC